MSSLAFIVEPGGSLQGEVRVPGDKSISHRAVMLGSIAEGLTIVDGFLEGEDSLATLEAFKAMGVSCNLSKRGRLTIEGVGLGGLKAPSAPLQLGNSGTSMRLLCGLLAAQPFASTLCGDESLSQRPMARVAEPLRAMGARVQLREGNFAPIRISPARLRPIDYEMPVASAQIKSCLLLAALHAEGESRVTEPAPCRDHTERMLRAFGCPVREQDGRVSLRGGGRLQGCHIQVPGDFSSAAFFMAGASISPGSDLLLRGVGLNPTRRGLLAILRAMGADLRVVRQYQAGAEPAADLRVKYAPLQGVEVPLEQVPLAIDELPVLMVAAACARGRTVLRGAAELRVKESDRIQVMADGLEALGIEHEVLEDGIIIVGGEPRGGEVSSGGDHRVAMSFAMAALRAKGRIVIDDCRHVATSFPGFSELAKGAGLRLQAVAG